MCSNIYNQTHHSNNLTLTACVLSIHHINHNHIKDVQVVSITILVTMASFCVESPFVLAPKSK